MAANFRNRISMQPMRSPVMECRGLPLLLFLVGPGEEVWGEFFLSKVVFGVESGVSTVQFPPEQVETRLSCRLF
jgi:hypothetical protein